MANKNRDLAQLSVRQLRTRRRRLAAGLPDVEALLRGALVDQRRRCGKAGCTAPTPTWQPAGPSTGRAAAAGCCMCRPRWSSWSAAGSTRPPTSRRSWPRSRRSTPSCWPGGSWTECSRSPAGRTWSWSPWWPTWPKPPWRWELPVSAHPKITPSHLDRAAIVYVRQSTLAQVRDNTESTARQYGLADQAARLGWPRARVEVVDADLGLSGRSAEHRPGFRELVGRVCVGEVGAILGLEISRLARSSADLSRLLDLAGVCDTLVIDADGVYDLADFNDRLLLGLKSTMSEAELHVLAGRLQGAKRAAAERGQLRFPLPVGYVYDDEGATVIDPDQEVAHAVADVFAAFQACGSAYGVVAAFKGRRFPLRAYGGIWAGQLRWGRLTHSRVLGILANPA